MVISYKLYHVISTRLLRYMRAEAERKAEEAKIQGAREEANWRPWWT